MFASFYGELKVSGRVKGLGFYLVFFCLAAEQQDYPSTQVMNQEKTLEAIYTKRIQLFCCHLDTLLKIELQTQG